MKVSFHFLGYSIATDGFGTVILIVLNSPLENTGKVNFSVFTNLLEAMDISLEKKDFDRIKR